MNELTPTEFLKGEWFLRFHFANGEWIFGQPSSSLLVFILSALIAFYGVEFIRSQQNQKSRRWCGIALLLNGMGTMVAGIYYQSFGYQIRCDGLAFCAPTSLWESLYLSLSSLGVMAFLFAIAFSSLTLPRRRMLIGYAVGITLLYNGMLVLGIFEANLFLVSYEFSKLFTGLSVLLLCFVNGFDYKKNNNKLSGILLRSYFLLFITSFCYYLYNQFHITEWLWAKNLWLSQNDILHLGMILWIIYIGKKLSPMLSDMADV